MKATASPYRELTRPVLAYLDVLDQERYDGIITVVIPESVTKVNSQWLHNQRAFALKARLLYRPDTVVVSVPVHVDVDDSEDLDDNDDLDDPDDPDDNDDLDIEH